MGNDTPQYKFELDKSRKFDSRLKITEDGETVAELDAQHGPAVDDLENIEITSAVCESIFGGHHYEEEVRQEHQRKIRKCVLCGKQQIKIERWKTL